MFSCLDPPVMTTDIEWTRDGEVIDNDSNNELTVEPETGVYCCSVDGIIVRCAYIFQTSMYHIFNICVILCVYNIITCMCTCACACTYACTVHTMYVRVYFYA